MANPLSALAADFAPGQPLAPVGRSACQFFACGTCSFGQNCRDYHGMNTELSEQASQNGDEDQYGHENEHEDEITREIDALQISTANDIHSNEIKISSGTVTFSDGAKVLKVKLHSETSSIQIINLDAGATSESVASFVAAFGGTVDLTNIKFSPSANGSRLIATVKFEDSLTGKRVVDHFNRVAEPGNIGETSMKEIQPLTDSGTWLETSTVKCIWRHPQRNATLSYNNPFDMELAATFLDANDPFHNYQRPDSPVRYNKLQATIHRKSQLRLYGIDRLITQVEVEMKFYPFNLPDRIRIWEAPVPPSRITALRRIELLVRDIGPLQLFEDRGRNLAGNDSVQVTYLDSQNAARAVSILHGTTPEGFGKLTVQHIKTMKFKILTKTLNAIKPELDRIVGTGPMWIKTKTLETSYSLVRLSCSGCYATPSLAAARIEINKLLVGEVVLNDGKAVWHSKLQDPTSLSFLTGVSRSNNLHIYRNDQRRQLIIYGGDVASRLSATRTLVAKVKSFEMLKQTIPLTKDHLSRLLLGDLQKLQGLIGENASLNVISKTLTINGSAADFRVARCFVLGKHVDEKPIASDTEDCVTCYTFSEDSIKLKCGHVYCLDCFRARARAAASEDNEIDLYCQGNNMRCRQTITLEELYKGLELAGYEALLRVSSLNYIRSRPAEFQYCPTPGCEAIYRPTYTPGDFHCTECFLEICGNCHSTSHPNMNCASNRQRTADALHMAYVNDPANNTKICPRCQTSIEKIDGCNHITCRGCNCHFCWVCSKTFVDGPEGERGAQLCESHLVIVHGGLD